MKQESDAQMLIGYARVSKRDDQDIRGQVKALRDAGAVKVHQDHASAGTTAGRPALHKMLDQLRPGHVVVVVRIDRISRSLRDFILLVERIHGQGGYVRSIAEGIDTSTAQGEAMAKLFGVLAEIERGWIRERTRAGVAAARARGEKLGRRRSMNRAQLDEMVLMISSGRKSKAEAARIYRVHRSTIARQYAIETAGEQRVGEEGQAKKTTKRRNSTKRG
jgi:DNA invertase Pin-like site-specific DNA recombinase